jgi:RimJ/RimL family protein N-acetyltransferase
MLRTDRLILRDWREADVSLYRQLISERDPRVPAHRRLDAAGHPTEHELIPRIHALMSNEDLGLKVACLGGDPTALGVGYCGLVHSEKTPNDEPEIAFEFLRSAWGHGYATEAAGAVVDAALDAGHTRLWATVWEWNVASLKVLKKPGFTESGKVDTVPGLGNSVYMVLDRSTDRT